jgi:hypothetical protein
LRQCDITLDFAPMQCGKMATSFIQIAENAILRRNKLTLAQNSG